MYVLYCIHGRCWEKEDGFILVNIIILLHDMCAQPEDRLVMTGQAPFEFRLREKPLSEAALKAQCNKDWRDIIYE